MKKTGSSSRKRVRTEGKPKGNSKAKKQTFVEKSNVWTFEERCRLAEAQENEAILKQPRSVVYRYVGTTKKGIDILNYRKYNRMVEQGKPFAEFKNKAPLDAWIELAEKNVPIEDKRDKECIPQIMTVAAFENSNQPGKSVHHMNSPNYSNIYNFLSILLRNGELHDLPPVDAQALLTLLDELVSQLANSLTMLQKEFLHEAFSVLSREEGIKIENNEKNSPGENKRKFPSLNPINVPQNLLEFRKKTPAVIDLGIKWRTKVQDQMF